MVRIEPLAAGDPGSVKSELPIDSGPGYREYYKKQGQEIVVLGQDGWFHMAACCGKNDCVQPLLGNRRWRFEIMASLTIRNISDNTTAKLKDQARTRGRSLEAHVRYLLDRAADTLLEPANGSFAHDLIAMVEPGEDIEMFIDEQDQEQSVIEL